MSGKQRIKKDSKFRVFLLVLYALIALKGLEEGDSDCGAHWHREQTLKRLSEVKSPMLVLHEFST
jgi:hypothetical protein